MHHFKLPPNVLDVNVALNNNFNIMSLGIQMQFGLQDVIARINSHFRVIKRLWGKIKLSNYDEEENKMRPIWLICLFSIGGFTNLVLLCSILIMKRVNVTPFNICWSNFHIYMAQNCVCKIDQQPKGRLFAYYINRCCMPVFGCIYPANFPLAFAMSKNGMQLIYLAYHLS